MKIGILAKPVISEINYKVLNKIFENQNFQISLVIIDCRPKASIKRRIIKHILRGRGGYIIIMGLKQLFRKKGNNYITEEISRSIGIDLIKTDNLYSSSTKLAIEGHKLDILILINGFGIIKKELLSITPLGMLSYHHGNMRYYRGMPPAFWELYNNEKVIGITVQKLESGLDCGIPIVEKTVQIGKTETLKSLSEKIYEAGGGGGGGYRYDVFCIDETIGS